MDVVYTGDHFYTKCDGARFGYFKNKNTLILHKKGME